MQCLNPRHAWLHHINNTCWTVRSSKLVLLLLPHVILFSIALKLRSTQSQYKCIKQCNKLSWSISSVQLGLAKYVKWWNSLSTHAEDSQSPCSSYITSTSANRLHCTAFTVQSTFLYKRNTKLTFIHKLHKAHPATWHESTAAVIKDSLSPRHCSSSDCGCGVECSCEYTK